MLREHRRAQAADKRLAGDGWRGEEDCHAFTTGRDEPRHRDYAPRKLINADDNPTEGKPPAEPLPYARLHDLRPIHATTLLLAGVRVHVVEATDAEQLTHAVAKAQP